MLRNAHIPVSDPSAGLRVTEIFCSLQGEALTSGAPTVFIRLTGCPLRCTYCDTAYAFEGGKRLSLSSIVSKAQAYHVKQVCVTGGEPLAQPNCLVLLTQLCDAGFYVSLETSGALDLKGVDARVSKVVDIKTPSSGEATKNLWENLNNIRPTDQLKFVIGDKTDYQWSKQQLHSRRLAKLTSHIWFSPVFNLHTNPHAKLHTKGVANEFATAQLATQLADWIVEDRLPVRLQLQLHKMLWSDAQGK